MDVLHHWLWYDDKFLGVTWNAWKIVGMSANLVFSSRFIVQWYVTEKQKQVVVPLLFWWLSLLGSLIFLIYAIHDREPVFIVAYAFNWVPYIRNVVIHQRHEKSRQLCPDCGCKCPPKANFCGQCGMKLSAAS